MKGPSQMISLWGGGGGWRGTVIRSHSLTSGGELLETVTFSSIAIDCELN